MTNKMKRVIKYILIFLAVSIGVILLMALLGGLFVSSIYSFFLGKIFSIFGLDLMLSRVIAIFPTIFSLLLLPWIISFLIFGRRKKELSSVTSIAVTVCYLALYYGTADVFFDRKTGQPAKYYIKTLDGFKFSSAEDFDPKFGIKFKPITQEVIKEYFFWQKTGKLEIIPEVTAGKYFDMITGEPIVWYSERPDGTIKLFALPGHDPTTGELLKPITKEIVTKKLPKTAHDEPTYDRMKAINLIKEGKIDLNWYFKTKENSFDLESETVSLGTEIPSGRNRSWVQQYDLFVEKIIFLPPSFIVAGVCFRGATNVERMDISDGRILDSRNIKHRPLNFIGAEKRSSWFKIGLNKGEVKRVFYVLEYIPPEELEAGAHTGTGDDYVRFCAENPQKPTKRLTADPTH